MFYRSPWTGLLERFDTTGDVTISNGLYLTGGHFISDCYKNVN